MTEWVYRRAFISTLTWHLHITLNKFRARPHIITHQPLISNPRTCFATLFYILHTHCVVQTSIVKRFGAFSLLASCPSIISTFNFYLTQPPIPTIKMCFGLPTCSDSSTSSSSSNDFNNARPIDIVTISRSVQPLVAARSITHISQVSGCPLHPTTLC